AARNRATIRWPAPWAAAARDTVGGAKRASAQFSRRVLSVRRNASFFRDPAPSRRPFPSRCKEKHRSSPPGGEGPGARGRGGLVTGRPPNPSSEFTSEPQHRTAEPPPRKGTGHGFCGLQEK